MKNKKIGLVTVYNACNYGSFLQAYGLQKFLEENNYEANFIKIPVDYNKVICLDSQTKEYAEYESKKYERLVENQKMFNIVDKIDNSYKSCVIGSDTIWNLFDKTYSNIPYFIGRGLEPCKNIISYAASIGPAKFYKLFTLKLNKVFSIRKFNHISVRDDKTEKFVKIIGKPSTRVLDPTFLVDFEKKEPVEKIDKKFILVYTYGLTDEKVKAIKKFAKDNNCIIIATGSLCDWADMNLAVDSFEWLWLVKNAEYVITTTFHGSIFSLKYNKKFAVMINNSAKIISLLKEFNILDRICDENSLSKVLSNDVNYASINEIMIEKADKSKKYLLESIGE